MKTNPNIQLASHDTCTGCAACASVCPKGCISMKDEHRDMMRNAFILKVPHHDSKYNLNSTMINVINSHVAIVSAKSEEKHFSPLVKNALKRKGTKVYCTMKHGCLRYNHGFEERSDYSKVQPL